MFDKYKEYVLSLLDSNGLKYRADFYENHVIIVLSHHCLILKLMQHGDIIIKVFRDPPDIMDSRPKTLNMSSPTFKDDLINALS